MDKYIGKLLDGRYEIQELIGSGGMANVYKARCRLLNRYVAIKILKDEFAKDEEFRRRFHNESQAVAMLAHHNIVSIYDVSKTDDLEYIVMELVDGVTLKEYLKQQGGSLSWQDTLFFAAQICAALNHAHSRGIVHQDIKPHNILVLKNGEVKVTDFGIAKMTAVQDTRVVQEAIGSVHYMAPEQAKGGRIDARTDLYSLGVVMYEMLTGRLPFEGDNPLSIVMQHLNALPLLPSELKEGVPKAMDDIVMKAMSPDPDRRYPSAEALYRDLVALKNDPNMVLGYSLADTGRTGEAEKAVTDQTMRFYAGDTTGKAAAAETGPDGQQETDPSATGKGKKRKKGKKGEDDAMRVPMRVMALVLAVFFIGAFFLVRSLLSSSATETIEVPNFVGQLLTDVEADETYDRYVFQQTDAPVFDDTVEPGTILEQTPEAGERVERTSEPIVITVTLSTDEQTEGIEVPNVTGMSYQLALVELEKEGIDSDSVTVTYENSDEVDSGLVIRTTPEPGQMLMPDEELTLVVSEGEEIELQKVPYLVGMTQSQAQRELESVGLRLGSVTPVESDETPGTVLTQSIPRNVEVRVGSSVDIEVAKAREEEPEPEPPEDTEGSATLNVALPQTVEQAHVVVQIGGTVVHDATYDTAQGSVNISLTGTKGSTLVTVTVEGNTYEQVVEFQ